MAFVSSFSGLSVRVVTPSISSNVTSMSASARPQATRRAFLASGAAAAAALLAFGADMPALAASKLKPSSVDYAGIEAGVPLISGIATAIKAGDMSLAKSLANDNLVSDKLNKNLDLFASSLSKGGPVTKASQELYSATASFYDNLSKAVNAEVQDDAVAYFNNASNDFAKYVRTAGLTKLYEVSFAI
jgi:hypothetical protein